MYDATLETRRNYLFETEEKKNEFIQFCSKITENPNETIKNANFESKVYDLLNNIIDIACTAPGAHNHTYSNIYIIKHINVENLWIMKVYLNINLYFNFEKKRIYITDGYRELFIGEFYYDSRFEIFKMD